MLTAWGSIDNGAAGDSVWLDRTFDGGSSWDGLLGKAAIPGSWTGTRTLMYNLADPVHHARGMIRACGDAAGIQCTDWVHLQTCDVVCDGIDTPVGDNQPVAPATLDRTCDDNGKQFKGIFMRYLMDLADLTGVASYRTYARTQADSIWNADRDSLNRIGERWSGASPAAYPNARDWRTQASGLEALLASL